MQGQLAAAQQSMNSQNLMTLVGFLQSEDVREARGVVIKSLRTKSLSDWDEADKRAASLACSSYDIAAIMIRLGGVPAKPITDNWAPSIRTCYEVVRPWIEEMQKPENAGPAYLDDFGWLYSKVRASATTSARDT